jgi:hypothetical protein
MKLKKIYESIRIHLKEDNSLDLISQMRDIIVDIKKHKDPAIKLSDYLPTFTELPLDFKIFSDIDQTAKITGKEQECYNNSLLLARSEHIDLCIGIVFLHKDHIERNIDFYKSNNPGESALYTNSVAHAWNLKNGKVYDSTLKSTNNFLYFGKVMDHTKFQTDSDLENYLYQKIGA